MQATRAVVVLPGFPGSQLVDADFFPAPKDVWYSPNEFLVNGPDNLQLAANGIDPGPLASDTLTPSGPVDLGIYEPLLTQLANDGWANDFRAYDWRKSFAAVGQELGRELASKYADTRFWVVAHSAGGLIARIAYAYFATTPAAANWVRTVYLGTPHGGSYWAPLGLAGNYGDGSFVTMMGNAIANGLGIVTRLPRLPKPMSARFLEVLASWPGLYCLFPSESQPFDLLDPSVPGQWNLSTWSTANVNVDAAHLAAGRAEVKALAGLLGGPRPREACVVGTGTTTPASYVDLAAVGLKRGYTYSTNGDGTVLVTRATLPGIGTATVSVTHNNLTQQGAVLSRITGWLLDGIAAPEVIPAPQAPVANPPPIEASTWEPPPPRMGKQIKNDP